MIIIIDLIVVSSYSQLFKLASIKCSETASRWYWQNFKFGYLNAVRHMRTCVSIFKFGDFLPNHQVKTIAKVSRHTVHQKCNVC